MITVLYGKAPPKHDLKSAFFSLLLFAVLRIKPKTSCMPGISSISKPDPTPRHFVEEI